MLLPAPVGVSSAVTGDYAPAAGMDAPSAPSAIVQSAATAARAFAREHTRSNVMRGPLEARVKQGLSPFPMTAPSTTGC